MNLNPAIGANNKPAKATRCLDAARGDAARFSGSRAFTLPEMLIVVTIFVLLVAAVFSTQLWGMRMYRISQTKLTIADQARRVLNHVQDEIRSAYAIDVGSGGGDISTFRRVSGNAPRSGNALRIYPTDDTNDFVYYYRDEVDSSLKRLTSDGASQVLARSITNAIVFRAEDFRGNVLTNTQPSRVIQTTLEFYQQRFSSGVAPDGVRFEHYLLQTRTAQRNPGGG
jgi:prepilin-type N-terminal cleavage/methylation domain-containing protein